MGRDAKASSLNELQGWGFVFSARKNRQLAYLSC
jgi:hypothetical protein